MTSDSTNLLLLPEKNAPAAPSKKDTGRPGSSEKTPPPAGECTAKKDKTLRAIRRFCLDCQGGHNPSVVSCQDTQCLFYPHRRIVPDSELDSEAEAATPSVAPPEPLRIIRRFCMECAGSRAEVRECDAKEGCALWSYRFGVLPTTFKRVVARQKKQRTYLTLPGLALPGSALPGSALPGLPLPTRK